MSLFRVNIQINPREIIELNAIFDETICIHDLKRIIVKEQKLITTDNVTLKYNNIFMNDNNTLGYYGITDSKHIIKMYLNVQGSNQSKYISTDTASNLVPLLFKNKDRNNNRFRFRCQCRCPTCKEFLVILFAIFSCIFLATFVVSTIAFKKQYNIFSEYSTGKNDCDILNKICNDKCNEFYRNEDDSSFVFMAAFVWNWIFLGSILGSILVVGICILLGLILRINDWCFAGIISALTLLCSLFILFCIYMVTMHCWHITWTTLVTIRRYCDKDTPFYEGIMKWEIIDIIYTFMMYIILALLVCCHAYIFGINLFELLCLPCIH